MSRGIGLPRRAGHRDPGQGSCVLKRIGLALVVGTCASEGLPVTIK